MPFCSLRIKKTDRVQFKLKHVCSGSSTVSALSLNPHSAQLYISSGCDLRVTLCIMLQQAAFVLMTVFAGSLGQDLAGIRDHID